jgi:Asp-tRNA(Asn)/Glu-tRNA(Gln) amidotransferase A subunit family amidase
LKGARIGALKSYWGDAPEDGEVTGIIRKALDGFKAQGAEWSTSPCPASTICCADSSVIGDEFKFDLMAYLAKEPNAPVKSLGEIIERGLITPSSMRPSVCATSRKTRDRTYRQAMVKRYALAPRSWRRSKSCASTRSPIRRCAASPH